MKIDKISFTGADDQTDIEELVLLQEKYPFIEWAILYFPERDSLARNPSKIWREKFYRSDISGCAMHLCGSGIEQFAAGKLGEVENFSRIQINLKPNRASHGLVESLVSQCQKYPHIQFITQHNEQNSQYFSYWQALSNHAFLFDASLGKGLSPESWPTPVSGKDCGYAGGLSPHNIAYEMERIQKAVNSTQHQKIWIDMESGVRTDDEFDLYKVQAVLYACNIFDIKI